LKLRHLGGLRFVRRHLFHDSTPPCVPWRHSGFLRRLHRLVSLGTKVLRKWEGPTWAPEEASLVRLLTEQAIIEKLAYVMANPVKAGLVRHARD